MKLTLTLSLASAVTGFVIPTEELLSAWPGKTSKLPEWKAGDHASKLDGLFDKLGDELPYALETAHNIHTQGDHSVVDFLEFGMNGARQGNWLSPQQRGDHHHGTPNRTIYQLISENEHSTEFAKLVSKFDDVVECLNSTSADYTVFVPANRAFEKFKHAPTPPDEYLKKLISYHVSPDFSPVRTVFLSRTIRTFLKEKELGSNHARISTQFGLHGLTINFIGHIIKSDIVSEILTCSFLNKWYPLITWYSLQPME